MGVLEGKTALVTGGTGGIGLAIATRFAREGAHVYITGRRTEQLDSAVAAIGSSTGSATGIQADATVLADLDRVYAQIQGDGRALDVLVANVGGGSNARLGDITEEVFDHVVGANMRSTVFTVQKALPLLPDGAAIVLIGSVAADIGSDGLGLYSAAKAAVRSFARTWAKELSPRRIRVNVISPAAVKTPGLTGTLPDGQADAVIEAMGAHVPLGRIGEPEEVANVALFLASEQSSFMTGTNTYVDGGQLQI